MRDMQRPDTWSQDTPSPVTPEAFDALGHILARKIAQGVHGQEPGPTADLSDAASGQHGHSENARQAASYEWSARYLLNKMRIETS